MSASDDRFSSRRRQSASWAVGDRVLAPWEPEFLYAGTVREIQGADAHIDFDDGDSGWVPLSEIRPLRVSVDQPVMCRKEMGPLFYPAVIADQTGETVHVTFDDGDSEWTTVGAFRIPRHPGPGASPTHIGAERGLAGRLQRGSRVLAPWESFFLYPATVTDIQGDEVHVQYDDADAGWVGVWQVHPLELSAGLTVSVRGSGRLYQPAEVISAEGEQVEVRLESGATRTVPLASIRVPCLSNGPNARPTSQSGATGMIGWLIPVLVVVGLGALMVLLSM